MSSFSAGSFFDTILSTGSFDEVEVKSPCLGKIPGGQNIF